MASLTSLNKDSRGQERSQRPCKGLNWKPKHRAPQTHFAVTSRKLLCCDRSMGHWAELFFGERVESWALPGPKRNGYRKEN